MKINTLILFTFYLCFCACDSVEPPQQLAPEQLAPQQLAPQQLDVLNYHVYLDPNISEQSIKGSISIQFNKPVKANQVVFDAGNLKVTKIEGQHIGEFEQEGDKLIISLSNSDHITYEVQILYEGQPKRGLIFLPYLQQAHTVYATSHWMICNDSPDDKATLKLDLLVPNKFISIGSGVLSETIKKEDNKTLYSWHQNYETPPYTYGFAIGAFNVFHDKQNDLLLNYYAHNHTAEELQNIFKYTRDMLSFLEKKSGIPFPQNSYNQILIGNYYQEMSGFSILKNSYGKLVLNDSTETNLITHELAHQWWGNRITCENWNHFWLNEGFATYLSAAYNEHRFGQEKYQRDIDSYFKVYDKIRAKGGDKSLVFENWSNPSKDDRNLVYFKGAYVLHLLRGELGDDLFWKGLKVYTQKNYGQSVTTNDFQSAMEQATERNLTSFFNNWIYKKQD